MTPPTWPGIIYAHLVGIDFDVFQSSCVADFTQKSRPAPRGSARIIGTSGRAILSGMPGKPGPEPMSINGAGSSMWFEHQQAVDIVLEHHVLEVVNPRQVELGVGRAQHLVIAPEQVELRGIERDAAPLQDRFQCFNARCQSIGLSRAGSNRPR